MVVSYEPCRFHGWLAGLGGASTNFFGIGIEGVFWEMRKLSGNVLLFGNSGVKV